MIIYLVGDVSDQLKYKKRYCHALFTYGNIGNKKLNEIIKRRKEKQNDKKNRTNNSSK